MTSKLVIELEKAKIVPTKTVVCFFNRKFARQALYNRKKLKSMDKSTLGLTNDVSINENSTPVSNRIAYNCRKLKHQNLISKTYTVNGMVHLSATTLKEENQVKFSTCKLYLIYFQM